MKCSLVRDLLPLYIEQDCSQVTKKLVDHHLESCETCKKDYELMEKPLELRIEIEDITLVDGKENANAMWKKYYGKLILQGVLLFLFVYSIIVFLIIG
ncbi:zf-HC2 domain-containing protein [Metabacillus herbersteinensis]|uniref:Zf-HC2 domain-containing protein n=1 Tax=Metabacillus herbersteinensis TaxID=283816 RepID=A0ABV6GIJ7_9BACI